MDPTESLTQSYDASIIYLCTCPQLQADNAFLEILANNSQDLLIDLLSHKTEIQMRNPVAALENSEQLGLANGVVVTSPQV